MKNGFTFVELVVTLGISTLALIGLVNLFLVFNSVYGYQQILLATAGSAGAAMSTIEDSVLPASHVLTSHTFSGTTYASGTSTLILELPAVDSSGNIVSDTKDYVAFSSSTTMLYRLTQASINSVRISGLKQLSTTLQSLTFTYNDNDFTKVTQVTVDLQTQAQFKEQTAQSTLHEQMRLRNL